VLLHSGVMVLVGAEQLLLEVFSQLLDSVQLSADTVLDALGEGLLRPVFLQHQQLAVFIVGLEAGVVPVFDEVVAHIRSRLP